MSELPVNARRLLELLIRDGSAYRADIARSLKVSRTTASNLSNQLESLGLIEEVAVDSPGVLKTHLGVATEAGVFASVMFEAASVMAVVTTLDGRPLAEKALRIDERGAVEQRLEAGAELLRECLRVASPTPLTINALHLAVDTQMDKSTGRVYETPASRRWVGVNPKEYFVKAFDTLVCVQNSARLHALAEYLWGGSSNLSDLLYVQISYGVSMGHVVDGVVRDGFRGGSGEIGHVVYNWGGPLCTCGNYGCLMQYVSIPAFETQATLMTNRPVTIDQFALDVAQKETYTHEILTRASIVFGRMLTAVCHLIDPGVIVLGGEISALSEDFVEGVRQYLREHTLPLIGKNLEIAVSTLSPVKDKSIDRTVYAGIESLRSNSDIIQQAFKQIAQS